MDADHAPTPVFRLLAILLLCALSCGGILAIAYSRAVQRSESMRQALTLLEKLVLANRHLEITEMQPLAGWIQTRHVPSGRDVLFSFRDLAGDRTAVGLEDYPVESEPGWHAAAWVPVYSGAQVESYRYQKTDGTETGELRMLSATQALALAAYYRTALRREGLTVDTRAVPGGGWATQAQSRDRLAQVAVRLLPRERGTQILIEYAGHY